MDRASLVRTIRIVRSDSRQALNKSTHKDKALACSACNEAYATAEELVLAARVGWTEQVRKQMAYAQRLEQLALGDDHRAAEILAALSTFC